MLKVANHHHYRKDYLNIKKVRRTKCPLARIYLASKKESRQKEGKAERKRKFSCNIIVIFLNLPVLSKNSAGSLLGNLGPKHPLLPASLLLSAGCFFHRKIQLQPKGSTCKHSAYKNPLYPLPIQTLNNSQFFQELFCLINREGTISP